LFALLALGILLVSGLLGWMGVSVPDPRPEGTEGRALDGMIRVISLLDPEGLRRIVTNLVTNFTGFVPLGTVLVAMLGVGIAERSGLLTAAIKLLVLGAPKNLVTVVVVFAAIMSNTASEMGYVVVIPLAAAIFHALGRHPLAGLAAAFAGVSGGYSANLLIGTVDPLLAGITTKAANIIDPEYYVGPEANWYFMFTSTFLIAILGTFVTDKIIEPTLGQSNNSKASINLTDQKIEPLTALEKKGLIGAGISFAILGILLALTIVPEWGVLRHPETGEVSGSPFLKGIVTFIFITFAIPGYVYGRITK